MYFSIDRPWKFSKSYTKHEFFLFRPNLHHLTSYRLSIIKVRVSWFLEWRIDRCNEKSSGGKIKMGIHFSFFFGLPTISQWLLAPQQWFTYQNVQNFPNKQFCYFRNNREEVILKINQETKKNALHWPNCIALQWSLPVLWLDPGGCDMDLYFFLPDRPTPTFPDKKKIVMTGLFFYFKFPTDRLDKIGSSLIRHSRNQPTVA